MMTPQEVASCTFAKAVMGGYNMAAVDDFLDRLTEDYSALYKENSELKSKLKVLADNLKEYREMEETMRSALLTSQKMANSIVAEAEEKRDAMIADAAGGAKVRLQEIQDQVEQEEQRLAEVRERVNRELETEKQRLLTGQEELRAFIQNVTAVCNDQLALLERLPELPPEEFVSVSVPVMESVSDEPSQARAEDQAPARPQDQADAKTDAQAAKPAEDIARELADVFGALDQDTVENGDGGEDPLHDASPSGGKKSGRKDGKKDGRKDDKEGDTRVVNLDDLQFGRNYPRN